MITQATLAAALDDLLFDILKGVFDVARDDPFSNQHLKRILDQLPSDDDPSLPRGIQIGDGNSQTNVWR